MLGLVVIAAIFLAWRPFSSGHVAGSSSCAGVSCVGAAVVQSLPAAPAPPVAAAVAPKPCPYCNQDPNRWQASSKVPPPQVSGPDIAVIDGACGKLIYGLNQDERRPPASIAKIVTALVAGENTALTDKVLVKTSGWDLALEDGSSNAGLEAGEMVPVEDLLYALMLPSGNDAALALADNFGGPVQFATMEAARIRKIGLENTNLTNPDGRDAPNNYTSALDIGLLGRELMSNPVLRKIAGTQTRPAPWDGHTMWNTNYYVYGVDGATGVKFGFTEGAKETVVGSAMRNGREIFVAVLFSDFAYLDAKKLTEWAFANTTSAC
jgi:D-alanyl-D-alanine carboxypeptidase (penicillin-binding protein 5/6)